MTILRSIMIHQSEIEDHGDGAVFPENSVRNWDISGESPSSLEEENESLSESEVDRREFLRNERQERSRQLHQQINNTRVRNRGFRGRRGARGARGARGPRGARIQDGGKQFVWSDEQTRRNLKNFTSSVGPTRGGERRQAAA